MILQDSFILTPLSAVQTLSTITRVALAFGLLFALTYLVTYTRSTIVFTSRDGKREPLGVPYWLPFFGNLVSLFYDPTGFFWWTV